MLSKISIYRFNNAPTDQYDKDVGNKTSIRIVNSQVRTKPKNHQSAFKSTLKVVAKPQYKFIESPLYR